MTWGTTHEERVAKMRQYDERTVNGMWDTLLTKGTREAQDAFEIAAFEAGWGHAATPEGIRWKRR